MRRIAFAFAMLLLVSSPGCAEMHEVLFAIFGNHYTDGTTQTDRHANFEKQYENNVRAAETDQRSNSVGAIR
jgi:hypothetical protein